MPGPIVAMRMFHDDVIKLVELVVGERQLGRDGCHQLSSREGIVDVVEVLTQSRFLV